MTTNQLHSQLKRISSEIRSTLADRNVPDMQLKITITGRTLGRTELKIEYSMGRQYDCTPAEGGFLDACVEEFIHRFEWSKLNEAKALPAPVGEDDDQ